MEAENKKPENPYAFPVAETNETQSMNLGMTLIDHFAVLAMQSIMVGSDYKHAKSAEQVSLHSYAIADAMLKQRENES